MQLRFSTCRGMEIVEEPTGEVVAFVLKPLIEPDRGKILGFYTVSSPGGVAYVSAMDILQIGVRVEIRDVQSICNPYEIIRLQPILEDSRSVLGQKIYTENGSYVGRCADVQFDTHSMQLSWLFPRKWFRWRTPLPIQSIIEVRQTAIIVQDVVQVVPESHKVTMPSATLPEPGM